jgi:hypothetical protein
MNTRALKWATKPVRCIADNCRTPYLVNDGYFVLTGEEWAAYSLIRHPRESSTDSASYDFDYQARRIGWNPGDEVDLGPGLPLINAEGGVMSQTYNPTCAFAIRDQQIRVACLTVFITPKVEEFRYFVSDVLSISSLVSQLSP